MIPTNKDNSGCVPTSSKCVIWNGPDIACINLCTGDSVDIVIAKLADELCKLLDIFKIDVYNLNCLSECPAPANFQQLIQAIIDKICECCEVDPPASAEAGCPQCVVDIAECFYFQNPQGDTVTTMQLTDYVTAVGNRICTLVSQITTIQETLTSLSQRVSTLEKNSENAQREAQKLPYLNPVCISNSSTALALDEFVQTLEKQFCELRNATGLPNDILKAVIIQCADLNNEKKLSGTGVMGSISGWNTNPQNAAQSLQNIWLTLCDVRAAVKSILANCCGDSCDDIELELQAILVGTTLKIYVTGTIPTGFAECNVAGTLFTIEDSSGMKVTTTFSIATILNSVSGIQIDLTGSPLNTALDFNISATACFNNSDEAIQCQKYLSYILVNNLDCPAVTLASPSSSSVTYSFNHITGTITYTIELYDAAGTTLLASQTTTKTDSAAVTGTFGGLDSGTIYKVRVQMVSGEKSKTCEFGTITTQGGACPAPEDVTATITV
jgi:hypothetical protein